MDGWQAEVFAVNGAPITYETEPGKAVPVTDLPFVKEAKDFPTFIKGAIDAHREVGARVRLPGKDAKPEDRQAFVSKLYETGVLEAPPKDPSGYGLTRPDVLPEGIHWNEEMATEAASLFHKHGVSPGAAQEFMSLYVKALVGQQSRLKTDYATGMASLEKEFGKDKLPALMEDAKRLTTAMFKDHPDDVEVINASGLGDHPAFLRTLLKLAPFAQQDSSFVADQHRGAGDGATEGDAARAEHRRIVTDKTHPMHEAFLRGDPKVQEHINRLYRDAFGSAPVELGQGITVTGRPG